MMETMIARIDVVGRGIVESRNIESQSLCERERTTTCRIPERMRVCKPRKEILSFTFQKRHEHMNRLK